MREYEKISSFRVPERRKYSINLTNSDDAMKLLTRLRSVNAREVKETSRRRSKNLINFEILSYKFVWDRVEGPRELLSSFLSENKFNNHSRVAEQKNILTERLLVEDGGGKKMSYSRRRGKRIARQRYLRTHHF